jgi:hypothetical protein
MVLFMTGKFSNLLLSNLLIHLFKKYELTEKS